VSTWLDWYVRWRIEAPESRESLAHQMRMGATNPLMAFAETIEEILAYWEQLTGSNLQNEPVSTAAKDRRN
jgi:hypothetical protein